MCTKESVLLVTIVYNKSKPMRDWSEPTKGRGQGDNSRGRPPPTCRRAELRPHITNALPQLPAPAHQTLLWLEDKSGHSLVQ